MIPQFPTFKKLEISDKQDVEDFTRRYPPYSDFNLAGTLSWDIKDMMHISQLNDNYVIRFVSYFSGEPFYTFLGNNEPNDTVEKLLDLSESEKIFPELKLIPEELIKGLDGEIYNTREDIDNFDYIYELEQLKDYKGSPYESKRGMVNRFLRKYPQAQTQIISLQDPETQSEIMKLYQRWIQKKIESDSKFESFEEIVALEKIFKLETSFNLISIGIYIDNQLTAFSISELLESEYTVSHVVKADTSFTGIYAFLMQKNAETLLSFKKRYLNFEHDGGEVNLRNAKVLFRPCHYLKKYLVSRHHPQ